MKKMLFTVLFVFGSLEWRPSYGSCGDTGLDAGIDIDLFSQATIRELYVNKFIDIGIYSGSGVTVELPDYRANIFIGLLEMAISDLPEHQIPTERLLQAVSSEEPYERVVVACLLLHWYGYDQVNLSRRWGPRHAKDRPPSETQLQEIKELLHQKADLPTESHDDTQLPNQP